MNIRESLLKEKRYSKESVMAISEYASSSKKRFTELMECFLSNDRPLVQRAAGCVGWAARKKPEYISPYIPDIVKLLQRTDVHNGVIRNCIRILQETDIPGELHGEVMNTCFEFIEKPSTPIAIKAFSLTTLYNLSLKYPEIQPELKLIIEELWDNESAGFKSRGSKILKALK